MILHILLTVRRFTECFCGWVRIFPDNICRSQRTASVWRNKERYVCNEKNFDTEKIRHCSFSIEKDPILYRRNFKNIYIELCILKTRVIRSSKNFERKYLSWKYTRFKCISGVESKEEKDQDKIGKFRL